MCVAGDVAPTAPGPTIRARREKGNRSRRGWLQLPSSQRERLILHSTIEVLRKYCSMTNLTKWVKVANEGWVMLDVVIRGGLVIDGTGASARRADVGIRGDRIVDIGEIS